MAAAPRLRVLHLLAVLATTAGCRENQPSSPARGLATERAAGAGSARAAVAAPLLAATAEQATDDRHAPSARDDASVFPCTGLTDSPFSCAPRVIFLAEGALARARRRLAACADCPEEKRVQRTVERLESHVRHLKKERTVAEFRAAMHRGEIDEAAQLLADAPAVEPAWHKSARRWLADVGRPGDDPECKLAGGAASLVSPAAALVGQRVRILITLADTPPAARGRVVGPDGQVVEAQRELRGAGPPAWRAVEFSPVLVGQHRFELFDATGQRLACRRVGIRATRHARQPAAGASSLWPSGRGWEASDELLYAAFVEQLFSDREGRRFRGLDEVTRSPERNLLFDHGGPGEDARLNLRPDCADAPYFLRAYFAFKLGLPFGWHDCAKLPCSSWQTNLGPLEPIAPIPTTEPAEQPKPAVKFERFLRQLRDVIVARGLRTPLRSETSDFYPVALERASLRPGTVFSDPYGHTLTLVRWEEAQDGKPGKLVAVDAQPDGTLGIKRFWRGTFVFTDAQNDSGHGFKAFRPIVLDREGLPRLLSNAELSAAHGFVAPSFEQHKLAASDFYTRVEGIVRPEALAPEVELEALVEALLEQLRTRVEAIEIAEELLHERNHKVIEMPRGREVFHTSGPWEALSTPCRDLRLLVGMDIVLAFPAAHPERREALERRLAELTGSLAFEYRRSDGAAERLTLAEALRRQPSLDMAYNPNDCPELRWGAPEGSVERRSCTRTAPPEQRRRMQQLRHWFQKRYACG